EGDDLPAVRAGDLDQPVSGGGGLALKLGAALALQPQGVAGAAGIVGGGVEDAAGYLEDAVAAVDDQGVVAAQPIDLDLGDVGERDGLALGARGVGHLDVELAGVGGIADERDGVRVARASDLEDGRWTENREADVGDGPGPPAGGAGQ